MHYRLEKGQSSEDILFWMAELAREKFSTAMLRISGDIILPQRLSLGLDDSMYARCIPSYDPFSVSLCCDGENLIVYDPAFPRFMRVEGRESFVNEVMSIPQPKHHLVLFYGRINTNGTFSMNKEFRFGASYEEKMRECRMLGDPLGMRLYVSTVENGFRITPVEKMDANEELMDILLKKDEDNWFLFRMPTGMIYTAGFRLTEAEEILCRVTD